MIGALSDHRAGVGGQNHTGVFALFGRLHDFVNYSALLIDKLNGGQSAGIFGQFYIIGRIICAW